MMPLKIQHPTADLPAGWELGEVFSDQQIINDQEIFLHGIQALHPKWGEVVGSAAALYEDPGVRAWYELLERVHITEALARKTLVLRCPISASKLGQSSSAKAFGSLDEGERPQDCRLAKSNGVAIHKSWQEACLGAAMELLERHVILSSWIGNLRPETISNKAPQSMEKIVDGLFEPILLQFAPQEIPAINLEAHVSCLLLFPKKSNLPFCIGFGATNEAQTSVEKAALEACQRLGFLWGEAIPKVLPEFAASHLYHQEYYLFPKNHRLLRDWVLGRYWNHAKLKCKELSLQFADLGPTASPHQVFVAKAFSSGAIPLVFGRWRQGAFKKISEERLIHPIS